MNRIHRLVGIEAPRSSRFGGPLAGLFVISIVFAFIALTQASLIQQTSAKQSDRAVNDNPNARMASNGVDEALFVDGPSYGQQERPAAADAAAKIKALDSSDPNERAAAACSLGKSRALEAIPLLIRKLGDDARIVALRCWDGDAWSPALDTFKEPTAGEQAAIALAAMGKFSVEPLIAALGDANPSVRRNAAWAIGEIRGGHSVDRAAAIAPLLNALNDSDAWTRKAAAFSLGEIRDERAGEPLIVALNDTEPQVRDMAARALGEMKDERAVKQLIARLVRDEDSNVRSRSAWALGEMKAAAATEALTAALNDEDQEVRNEAKQALAEILD